jgi:hypothetical protein
MGTQELTQKDKELKDSLKDLERRFKEGKITRYQLSAAMDRLMGPDLEVDPEVVEAEAQFEANKLA